MCESTLIACVSYESRTKIFYMQPLFYEREFSTAADSCLALLGMNKEDIAADNACLVQIFTSFCD